MPVLVAANGAIAAPALTFSRRNQTADSCRECYLLVTPRSRFVNHPIRRNRLNRALQRAKIARAEGERVAYI
jgi:hypothetical protein